MLHSHFNSWHAFLMMGGFAAYVWSAFGFAAIVVIANIIFARYRHHQVLKALYRYYRMPQAVAKTPEVIYEET